MKLKQVLIGSGVLLGLAAVGSISVSLNRDHAVRAIRSDYNTCYAGQPHIAAKDKYKRYLDMDIFKDPKDRSEVEELLQKAGEAERSCEKYYEFTKTWGSNLFEDPVERSERLRLKLPKP